MAAFDAIRRFLRIPRRAAEQARADVDTELAFHIERRIDELVAAGIDEETARNEARREFGDIEVTRTYCRQKSRRREYRFRLTGSFDGFRHDLRYTLRTLRKSPGFVLVAILSLAVGIGADTAIYSIYTTLFDDDRGVTEAHELVLIGPNDSYWGMQLSYADYLALRTGTTDVLDDLFLYEISISLLDRGDESEMVFHEFATANYFDVLGVGPALGRIFITDEDDRPGTDPIVVLSHDCWRQRYGADPEIVGRALRLGGHPFTVVGVAAPDFVGMFPLAVDFWVPLAHRHLIGPGDDALSDPNRRTFWAKGRLRDGIELAQARQVIEALGARMNEQYPGTQEFRLTAIPSKDAILTPEIDQAIRMLSLFLMGLVGLVILIACTNLASIMLARASTRRREIGIRLAIGAGRGRLVRQMLTESLLLALGGGLAGVAIAHGLIELLLALRLPLPLPLNLAFGLDLQAVFFACILTLVTGIIFGLLPARKASDPNLVEILKGSDTGPAIHYRRFGLTNLLIAAQVTVSTLLLICTGLFLHSLQRAAAVDRGFDLRSGVVMQLPLELSGFEASQARTYLQEVKSRLGALPGVEAVAFTDCLPLDFSKSINLVYVSDSPTVEAESELSIQTSDVGPDYFRAMGIAIEQGRAISTTDVAGAPLVAVINRTFAERCWPGLNPIGRQIQIGRRDRTYTIVGVAADGKYRTLGEAARPYFYRAQFQHAFQADFSYAVVRTREDARPLIPAIRNVLREINPDLPPFDLKPVSEYLGIMLFLPRLVGSIAGALGLTALLLGITGLYGVIALETARRTREVGIRIALGAGRGRILRLVLTDSIRLIAVGLGLGLATAAAASQGLTALLIGIQPLDPVTFVGIPLLLIATALLATLQPARRAARIDPVQAVRQE